MNRRAALVLLMCAAPAAMAAKWIKLDGGGANAFYADRASIIKVDKNTRKAWSLQTFRAPQKTPEGRPYRSVKTLQLYACNEHTATLLAQVFYPEPLGKGEPVENYKYEKYAPEDIVPDSPQERALSLACAKR